MKAAMKEENENQKLTPRRAKDQYFIDWTTDFYVLIGQSLSVLILCHCTLALA